MLSIAYFFIDLCLLRRAPQDLPASSLILGMVVAASMLGSMLLALSAGQEAFVGLLQGLMDIGLTLALVYAILRLTDKPARFLQTATALVGADTFIGLIALLPLSVAAGADQASSFVVLAGFLFLGLVFWGVLATAHILRHALEIRLIQGILVAIAYDVLAFMLIGGMTRSFG